MLRKKSPETCVTEVRLVEAAAQLFARQGFKATTTKEIAQLAHLNEATLFRYFPRKPDLFLAALESHLSRFRLSHDLQLSLAADDAPEVVLPKLVSFFIQILKTQPELQSLLHVAGFELPETRRVIWEHFGPIFESLCAYFKRSADSKTIASIEPELAALGLLGAVSAHQLLRKGLTRKALPEKDGGQEIQGFVNLWLHGVAPRLEPQTKPIEKAVGAAR